MRNNYKEVHKNKVALLTGATGFLGSYLLKILLRNNYKVYALARGKKDLIAHERVLSALNLWERNLSSGILKNLITIPGDITFPDFNIKSAELLNDLIHEVDIVFHCAALVELRGHAAAMQKVNVDGTRNVLEFSRKCKNKGRLRKINYISTAYVVGDKPNTIFNEHMLEIGQNFNNIYEESKYKAEIVVRKYFKEGLNISVFRPSMIMGDSREGKTSEFRLFYEPIHFISKGLYGVFPINRNAFINLINVDTVANAIFLLGEKNNSKVYHIVSPRNVNILSLFKLASKYFSFKLPQFVSFKSFDSNVWTPAQKSLAYPFMPYFNYTTKFISDTTCQILSDYNFIFPEINEGSLIKVFKYCNKQNFINRKNNK